jgi:hypothetical protein
MRQLVRIWGDAPAEARGIRTLRSNLLNKRTRARLADVYRRTFLPRFVNGPIPGAWKLVRPLEDAQAAIQIVRPVYYWITAKSEPLLGDFCRDYILPRQAIVRAGIGTEEALNWLAAKGCSWSRSVATRVARGLLAALRDFGSRRTSPETSCGSLVLGEGAPEVSGALERAAGPLRDSPETSCGSLVLGEGAPEVSGALERAAGPLRDSADIEDEAAGREARAESARRQVRPRHPAAEDHV